jgi:shikimate dehydrogenase
VVDLVYTTTGTALVHRARERGVPVVDGLELLIGQGALSFAIFTGVPASTAVMRAALASPPPAG